MTLQERPSPIEGLETALDVLESNRYRFISVDFTAEGRYWTEYHAVFTLEVVCVQYDGEGDALTDEHIIRTPAIANQALALLEDAGFEVFNSATGTAFDDGDEYPIFKATMQAGPHDEE